MTKTRFGLKFLLAFGALLSIGLAKPAQAQQPDLAPAVELVRLFVAEHGRRFGAGDVPLLNDSAAARRFLVDEMAVPDLQGKLQFDPVYGAQDADISDLSVYPDPDTPMFRGAAQIRVDLVNFGAERAFVYTLVPVTGGQWQISDIYSDDDGWSLVGLMRQNGVNFIAASDEVTLGGAQPQAQAPAATAGQPAAAGQTAADSGGGEDVQVGMEEGDLPAHAGAAGGDDLLVILDASGSMWGQIDGVAKIATAKQALAGLVGDLSAANNVGLITYGHRREGDCGDIEMMLPVGRHGAGVVASTIDAITPRGKTPIAGALGVARDAFPAADRQANVLLISDGLETCGGDPCAAAEALAAAGIDMQVHVVGFDLNEAEHQALQCIAEKGNGTYYTADNADEFVEAVNQAVASVDAEPTAAPEPAPTPAPQPEPQSSAVFEETFDGPEIDPSWSIENAAENLAQLDGSGALFVAAAGKKSFYDSEDARNRYVLDQPLPDGDFDLVLEARLAAQTGQEHVWVSVYEAPDNQIGALLWYENTGCGGQISLSLMKVAGEPGSKPEKTHFRSKLFDGPIVNRICDAGERAYGDAVIAQLFDEGAVLRLKRRGRQITAAVEIDLPAFGDRPAETFVHESESITALRLSGKPSIFAGQWRNASPGESHYLFDRFAIEVPAQ